MDLVMEPGIWSWNPGSGPCSTDSCNMAQIVKRQGHYPMVLTSRLDSGLRYMDLDSGTWIWTQVHGSGLKDLDLGSRTWIWAQGPGTGLKDMGLGARA